MRGIREILPQYRLKDIWNMNESGLFYGNGPRRSYLTNDENRSETRGTGLQTNKQRVSIVMEVNADGIHSFHVHSIGQSTNPDCFRQRRFVYLKEFYHSQQKSWTDRCVFKKWIEMWHKEVKEKSNSPWLMILDNCGNHELSVSLPGVRFEFLAPRSTEKYQPLYLGLIAYRNIKYRSILLRCVILMIEARSAGRTNFTEDSGRGKWDT